MKTQTINYSSSKEAIEKFPEDYLSSYYKRMGVDCGYEEYFLDSDNKEDVIDCSIIKIRRMLERLLKEGYELLGFTRLYFPIKSESYELSMVIQFKSKEFRRGWDFEDLFKKIFDEYVLDGLIDGDCSQDWKISGLDTIQLAIWESY